MKKHLLILVLTTALFSCQVIKSSDVKTAEIYGPKITQTPTLADLEVIEKKVKGKAEGNSGSSISGLKALAVSDALKKSNADILVEPRYDVLQTSSKIFVEVNGYPATYKNFRAMEEKDSTIVQYSLMQYSTGKSNQGSLDVSKKSGKTALGVLFGAIIISAIGIYTY
jgi:hypothetical protein